LKYQVNTQEPRMANQVIEPNPAPRFVPFVFRVMW
jgi:hypothetical protein